MNPQETATTITEIAPDTTLNLEQFLDDSFLEGEEVEKRPLQLAAHHSPRGGAYKVLPANQSAPQ
jgi:hypothetical protein